MSTARILVSIAAAASSLAIVASIVSLVYLVNDVNNYYDDVTRNIETFKVLSSQMFSKLLFYYRMRPTPSGIR